MKNSITSTEIEAVIKISQKQKPRTRWLHRRILSNVYRRANAYSSKTLSKNCRGRNTSKLITLIPKLDKNNTQKRKVQANITDEHRYKNLQQNSIKQNPTTHSV